MTFGNPALSDPALNNNSRLQAIAAKWAAGRIKRPCPICKKILGDMGVHASDALCPDIRPVPLCRCGHTVSSHHDGGCPCCNCMVTNEECTKDYRERQKEKV